MPKGGRSFEFCPRRREEGEDPDAPLTRLVSVNYEALEALFHLPLKDAARELGLCPTTFKKACRCFNLERWPFRKGQSRIPLARRDSTSSIDSSTSTVRASSELPRDCPDPFSAMFSSVAPEGLLQQASTTLDTRSYGEARYAGPAFVHKTFSPLDAPSCIDSSTKGRVFVGVPLPMPEGLPKTEPCGGEQDDATPLEAGPPRERPCVKAVMDYLDGPLAGNFDFMFADEDGAPQVGALLDGDDNGAEY